SNNGCLTTRPDQPVAENSTSSILKTSRLCNGMLISSYNVRTLKQIGKFHELCSGCSEYNIDFIAIQEHRWQTDKEYDSINSSDGKYKIFFDSSDKRVIG